MIQKQISIFILVLLILSLSESAYSQVTAKKYIKKKLPDTRIVIAPIIIDSVDVSFTSEFPKVIDHEDSLKIVIESYLQTNMRKYAEYKQLYCSRYQEQPNLKARKLNLSQKNPFEIFLPEDSQHVKMILKGANPQDPDFILFIEIGCVKYEVYVPLNTPITSGASYYMEKSYKIIFENVRYVFWNNIIGEIVIYNQKDLDCPVEENQPFTSGNKYLDILARYVLTRSPFSKTTMPFYF